MDVTRQHAAAVPLIAQGTLRNALDILTAATPQPLSLKEGISTNLNEDQTGFELSLIAAHEKMRPGEKMLVKLLVQSKESIGIASMKLKFDPAVIDRA